MKRRDAAGGESNEGKIREAWKWFFYYASQVVCRILTVVLLNVRCTGREFTSAPGPALILSTHQSYLDPILVGITFDQRLNYVARKSLFRNRVFATIIRWLDAIELDRDRGGLAGLKETMRRLKAGKKVLIFPEGTRSRTGHMMPLKPGFLVLARRCRVPLIPMAICGAYEVLPRGARMPRLATVRIAVGPWIHPEELEELSDAAALELISRRMLACDRIARARRC